jgi:nucleotide-binding universal stress UspA family protein
VSEERQALRIERILVALDASPHSLAALETAVNLARRFGAELRGLFVEDENLLRLATLPFVQEIGLFSAMSRRIDGEELGREVRAHSRRVRQVFNVTTRRAGIICSFCVARGAVLREVLVAASEADMLILGKAGWSLLRRGQLGSTVRGILPEHFGMTLILKEGRCLGDSLVVFYDGSPIAERALIAADALRRHLDEVHSLTVLLLIEDEVQARVLRETARLILVDRDNAARYRSLKSSADLMQLIDALLTERCGTLVLPARSAILQNSGMVELLEQVDLPILLVT